MTTPEMPRLDEPLLDERDLHDPILEREEEEDEAWDNYVDEYNGPDYEPVQEPYQ